MFRLFFPPTWAQNVSMRAEPVRSGKWFQTLGFKFLWGSKGYEGLGRGQFLLLPTMLVLNFVTTPETCSGEGRGAAGQAEGRQPTLAGSQGQQGRGQTRSPRRVPNSHGTREGGSGSSSAPAGRGFPRRKPGGARAAGATGRGCRRPAAERSPARRPRPGAPPHTLPSPYTPKYSPSPSVGKPFQRRNGALRRSHSRPGCPRRVARFWADPRHRPFSRLPGGTGWVSSLRRSWVGTGPMWGQGGLASGWQRDYSPRRVPHLQPGTPQLPRPPSPLYLPQRQRQLIETLDPALSLRHRAA